MRKSKSKEQEDKERLFKDWHACDDCNRKMGGVVPGWGHKGITVTRGTCAYCKREHQCLIPHCDYDWPKEGIKAVFD